MITVKLDAESEKRVEEIARRLGLSTSDVARDAILRLLEDEDDYALAASRLANPKPGVSHKEMKRRLGMDD